MYTFRKAPPAKSVMFMAVMFMVNYGDGRTAYLWVEDPVEAGDTYAVSLIARARQEQGTLPDGNITSIRRVR